MADPELKKCPKCGGDAAISLYSGDNVFVCGCTKNYCMGLPTTGAASEADAVRAWNDWVEQMLKKPSELLKNCPVCGAVAKFIDYDNIIFIGVCIKSHDNHGTHGKPVYGARSKAEAAAAWNKWVDEHV